MGQSTYSYIQILIQGMLDDSEAKEVQKVQNGRRNDFLKVFRIK